MPRDGSNVYSKAAGTEATSGTTIESAKYNAAIDDIVNDLNAARPIVAGGTGSATASGALTNLGALPLAGGTMTGDINMGTSKLINVGPGSATIMSSPLVGLRDANILVNPFLQVSQENGSTASGLDGFYQADQFRTGFAGTGAISSQRKLSNFTSTAVPFPYMNEAVVTTANPTLASTEFFASNITDIEGDRCAPLQFGTSAARNMLFAVYIETNYTGKAALAVRNAAATRSYCVDIDVVADTPEMHIIEIPGDTSGTWPKLAGVKGMSMHVTFATGTTYQTTPNTWSAGNFIGTPNTTNGLSTVNNRVRSILVGAFPKIMGLSKDALESLSIADWGWLMRPYREDITDCQRYYETLDVADRFMYLRADGGTLFGHPWHFKVVKRVVPTGSGTSGSGSITFFAPTVSDVTLYLDSTNGFHSITSAVAISRM